MSRDAGVNTDYDWPALSELLTTANETITELAERNRRQANTITFLQKQIDQLQEAHRKELRLVLRRWDKECARADTTAGLLVEAADRIELLEAALSREVSHVGP